MGGIGGLAAHAAALRGAVEALVLTLVAARGAGAVTFAGECTSCGACAALCPTGAVALGAGRVQIAAERCDRCLDCVDACPTGALITPSSASAGT
jgi:ferredoxin